MLRSQRHHGNDACRYRDLTLLMVKHLRKPDPWGGAEMNMGYQGSPLSSCTGLLVSKVLCQQAFFQEIPGSKEMGLDRANGHGEDFGHLFIRHSLEVA
jgi:hypothetical protein